MYSEKVEIINASGLHARPASEFVQMAKTFKSKVKVVNCSATDATPVNAKSITFVLTQCLSKGCVAELTADGEDEREAVAALAALIRSGFGE